MLAPRETSYLQNWMPLWDGLLCAYDSSMRIVCRSRGLSARSCCRQLWAGCWCTWRITRSATWDRQSRLRRLWLRGAVSSGAANGAEVLLFDEKRTGGFDELARFFV